MATPGLRVLGLAAVLGWAGAAHAAPPRRAEAMVLELRHYALSACLAQAFPAIRDEARAAQDIYLENGAHPAETYQAIQEMAGRWLQRSYPSFHDATLDVMKCVDFSESTELGALARRTLIR